jgi:hypothetical protein
MTKTIAEQFEDEYNPITTCMSSVRNAIERLERRLSALENQPIQSKVAESTVTGEIRIKPGDMVMVKYAGLYEQTQRLIDNMYFEYISPIQSQPVRAVDGGWISLQLTTMVWARKNDGGITKISFGATISSHNLYTHIRPYIPGESKPTPPEEVTK